MLNGFETKKVMLSGMSDKCRDPGEMVKQDESCADIRAFAKQLNRRDSRIEVNA